MHKTSGLRDPAAAFPLFICHAGYEVASDVVHRHAHAIGRQVADALSRQLPEAGSLTWTSRAAP